jgi:hypothetical protein
MGSPGAYSRRRCGRPTSPPQCLFITLDLGGKSHSSTFLSFLPMHYRLVQRSARALNPHIMEVTPDKTLNSEPTTLVLEVILTI